MTQWQNPLITELLEMSDEPPLATEDDPVWAEREEGGMNLTAAIANEILEHAFGYGTRELAEAEGSDDWKSAIDAANAILAIPAIKDRLSMVVVEQLPNDL